jgi:hypothetical protein
MAGLKPSVNHFASLDRNDPGDRRLSDLDANTATPALSLTQELFGNAYPSARDYIIGRNHLEKQAKAMKHAAKVQANGAGAKRGGYNNGSSRQQQQQQQQPGMSGGYRNGASRRQQPVAAQGMETPLAPTPPPSLYDINEFPSLN